MADSFSFIDLFAGIGGFRRGLERLGGECKLTCEINPYSQKTYKANYSNGHQWVHDIREFDTQTAPKCDIITAGFPCQPFSLAGVSKNNSLGKGTGFQHPTSGTLFFELKNVIRDLEPSAIILENVKNIKYLEKGTVFSTIDEVLRKELHYDMHYEVIDAQHWVPQHRERLIMVGFREETDFDFKNLKFPSKKPILGDILHPEDGTEVPTPYTDSDGCVLDKYTLTEKVWDYLEYHAEKHKLAGNGFSYGLFGKDDIGRTLSARYGKDGSEILIRQDGKRPRRLTPRECARIMGFDRGLDCEFNIPVSDNQAYMQFGNAVVPPMIEEVGRLVVKKI